jgi:hypothetical protein
VIGIEVEQTQKTAEKPVFVIPSEARDDNKEHFFRSL